MPQIISPRIEVALRNGSLGNQKEKRGLSNRKIENGRKCEFTLQYVELEIH